MEIGIIIAVLILAYQIRMDRLSRDESTKSNNNIAVEKHAENCLNSIKIYIEDILPKQKILRAKILDLGKCYEANAKNLHLRWITNGKLKFDKYQLDHIFHNRAPKRSQLYSTVYSEFRNCLPGVKNLFPHSYTQYFNFINTLDPILFHTAEEKPKFDNGKWVELHKDSVESLKVFIESTYNSDSELRNIWRE